MCLILVEHVTIIKHCLVCLHWNVNSGELTNDEKETSLLLGLLSNQSQSHVMLRT